MTIQWSLVLFTLFICLAAGSFAGIALTAWFGKGDKLQMPGLITALAALAVGGIASFLHLQTPARLFGQFANVASGITRELIMTVVIGIVMVAYFVVLRRGTAIPKLLSGLAVVSSVALVLIMSDSYLMAARPTWDTWLLPAYYLAGAAVLGTLAVFIIAKLTGEDETLSRAFVKGGLASLAVQALVITGYVAHIASVAKSAYVGTSYVLFTVGPFVPVSPTATLGRLLSGDIALTFWGLVVIVGVAVPLVVLMTSERVRTSSAAVLLAATGLVAALVGGAAFRALLYVVGMPVFGF
ncbi:MAG: dimethyl sulfoxide reductase anchor subunit family protein [Coriobacteriia bacterium]